MKQNTLAALTNLGQVTQFLLLRPSHPLTIQWVRPWEKSLHWTANYQIRPKFR